MFHGEHDGGLASLLGWWEWCWGMDYGWWVARISEVLKVAAVRGTGDWRWVSDFGGLRGGRGMVSTW